jgi:branched-chain amino acid transport system ATP-binding protein
VTPLLEARDLKRTFGAVVAAANVNVAVGEREVVGVIGANGAGKTTFVNMVTGYVKPSAGEVRYRGRDITRLAPREIARLGISRSFQIPQLFGELAAVDNVLVALGVAREKGFGRLRPLSRGDMRAAAASVLARFGLENYAGQRAGTLPQGVRKLLDIAVSTVGEPRLMLLDEPTSGISVDEKFQIMDTLMSALARAEVTVMFIEHDMEIVERYGSRVIAFYEGQVIADGEPKQVLADPDVRQYVVGTELHRRGAPRGGPAC